MGRVGWMFGLLAFVPGAAGAVELEGEIHLQPERIARDYLHAEQERQPTLALFPPAVPPPPSAGPPVPTDLDLTLGLEELPKSATLFQASQLAIEESLLNGLKRLKAKLLVDVSAYDSEDADKRWEGVEEVARRAEEELGEEEEKEQENKLINAAGGQFQGGLTLGVGTTAASASFGDVLSGTASALDLNPFRDVSAQFDFLIRTSRTDAHKGFDAFVIRVRAAFLGAFNGINEGASSDAATESELSVSFGFAW